MLLSDHLHPPGIGSQEPQATKTALCTHVHDLHSRRRHGDPVLLRSDRADRNPEFAVDGTQLYLHVICPIAILVSFELVESGYQITKRNTLACLIPFLIYSLVYVVNVVLLGETNGGWEDLYMLNTFVPFYFSLPAVWLLAYVIATLIRILSNRLDILRRNHLLSFWKEDADPIELNIEIYGLGRYNGMHDTRNELSIPYDLLELFAERYSRDPDDLLKIYMKGMMDALKMH